jgi:Zn-dependent protease
VYLLEPARTQWDLNWRMFGVPVRVHPMFWLLCVFLRANARSITELLVWVGCVFVSILLHEFGHVFMGQLFGRRGHIVLYSFGGLAIGSGDVPRRWQRIAVSAAGPLIQLALFAAVWLYLTGRLPGMVVDDEPGRLTAAGEMLDWRAVALSLRSFPPLARSMLSNLLIINLYWALLNLLPIWPLDGGKISREVFESLLPGRGRSFSLGLSMFVAGLIAVNSVAAIYGRPLVPYLYGGGAFTAVLFGLLAYSNFQEMQMLHAAPGRWEYPDRRDQDDEAWKR